MESTRFGQVLAKERRHLGLSLRQLADAASLNPGYLSRLEAGKVIPQEENLLKLADALAAVAGIDRATLERYRLQLVEAAGRLPEGESEQADIKEQFRLRLKSEKLSKAEIQGVMGAVSLPTMMRVIKGEESLTIRRDGNQVLLEDAKKRGEEVVVIPHHEHNFRAGNRAVITVKGALEPAQQEQLRIIARLVHSMLR